MKRGDIVTVAAENGRFDDSVSGQNHGVEGALQAISHVLLALLAELEEVRSLLRLHACVKRNESREIAAGDSIVGGG